MEFNIKKDNFSKIFKYDRDNQNLYLRVLSANTDSDLTQIITDYISNKINEPLSFEDKKSIQDEFVKIKNACSSQYVRLINCESEEVLSEIVAQNYTWWRVIKSKK